MWENQTKVRDSDVNFGPNCFSKLEDDPFFIGVVESFAGRLLDEGYLPLSNQYCMVCLPPKNWLYLLADHHGRLPSDYLTADLTVEGGWKEFYCSRHGDRKTVHPRVYYTFKKLLAKKNLG